jgi:hypothetical protein
VTYKLFYEGVPCNSVCAFLSAQFAFFFPLPSPWLTTLMVAMQSRASQETLEFLVATGADINAEDEVPKHPIDFDL